MCIRDRFKSLLQLILWPTFSLTLLSFQPNTVKHIYFFIHTFTLPTKHRKTQYTFPFTISLYQPNTVKHNIFSLLQFIFSILILRLTTFCNETNRPIVKFCIFTCVILSDVSDRAMFLPKPDSSRIKNSGLNRLWNPSEPDWVGSGDGKRVRAFGFQRKPARLKPNP